MSKDKALARIFEKHTRVVGTFIYLMDNVLETDKTLNKETGKKMAELINRLDMANDQIRYFDLGVDYRKDNKEKFFADCLKNSEKKNVYDPTFPD